MSLLVSAVLASLRSEARILDLSEVPPSFPSSFVNRPKEASEKFGEISKSSRKRLVQVSVIKMRTKRTF